MIVLITKHCDLAITHDENQCCALSTYCCALWNSILAVFEVGNVSTVFQLILQHPQLIEKRRAVFANLLKRHIGEDFQVQGDTSLPADSMGDSTSNLGLKQRLSHTPQDLD